MLRSYTLQDMHHACPSSSLPLPLRGSTCHAGLIGAPNPLCLPRQPQEPGHIPAHDPLHVRRRQPERLQDAQLLLQELVPKAAGEVAGVSAKNQALGSHGFEGALKHQLQIHGVGHVAQPAVGAGGVDEDV
jgi:hypothetical protein